MTRIYTSSDYKLSATVLMLRQTRQLEVFMVVRHHRIEFASGALVFPGGKVSSADADPQLRDYCDGHEGLNDKVLSTRIAALRELFEESGVLLARTPDGAMIGEARLQALQSFRPELDSGRLPIKNFLRDQNLRLAPDLLTPYAHWITPDHIPYRFDTYFYLAEVPDNQEAVHDGGENVDSAWINPKTVIHEADEGKWTIIFPTRMNIIKLARADTVAEALTNARAHTIVTVKPELIIRNDERMLTIPLEAGYGVSEAPPDIGLT